MKKLYKSKTNKMFCGVCGGVAEYLEIDPNLVRIIWFVLAFTVVGFFAYIAAAFLLPFQD